MVAATALSRMKSHAWPVSMFPVTEDVAGLRIYLVNAYFIGTPDGDDRSWVLVDTGLRRSAGSIIRAAEKRFGRDTHPVAIVLTHGHFDHVGTAAELADHWDVPIYAHEKELPFLTGQQDYPPPDPTVGGGMMAYMASAYPHAGVDLGERVRALPADGHVPLLPGWRWVHTPGHAPGHVSLYRDHDRVLVAGDAFTTTNQQSSLAVLTQYPKVYGPPTYYTPDWAMARESVERCAHLMPAVAATGHGLPMYGERLERGLEALARDFDEVAVPRQGRYVHAYDSRRPERKSPLRLVAKENRSALIGLGIAAGVGAAWWAISRRRRWH